jgi:1,4-dihydroxy-2-naphthoate octaprenyltransferase
MSAVNLTSVNSPGFLKAVVLAVRPKTLSAAVVPVLVATALVKWSGSIITPWISIVAVLSALLIQIGTNFVNDAIDFDKGADGETRLGPKRATQSGWLSRGQVMTLAYVCFGGAFALGVPLVLEGGWPIVVIGLISLVMGYAYTGGPFPLAYLGLGDFFVILFFGVIAVSGVFFLHAKDFPPAALVAGLQVGLLATVLIAINNLRDLDQDRLVHKKTLAVRLGPKLGRFEVALLVVGAFALQMFWLRPGPGWAFTLPLFALPFAVHVVWKVATTPASPAFNRFLAQAGFVHMLFGVLLSIGLFLE